MSAVLRFIRHLISNITGLGKEGSFLRINQIILKVSLIALFISILGDLFTGNILSQSMEPYFVNYAGLMVIIPGAIGLRGNIYGSLASRLGSNLHIGLVSAEFKKSKILTRDILVSTTLMLNLSLIIAIMGFVFCEIFHILHISINDFALILMLGGLVSALIMLPSTIVLSFISFRKKWDPDNVTNPILSSSGDLIALPSLILVMLFLYDIPKVFRDILLIILILITIILVIYCFKSSNLRKIMKETIPIHLYGAFLQVCAGGVLAGAIDTLLANPALLALVPLIAGEAGSLISIFSSRISSALHMGVIKDKFVFTPEVKKNFKISLVLSAIVFSVLPFFSQVLRLFLGQISFTELDLVRIFLTSVITGSILMPVLFTLIFFISVKLFNWKLDPDNIVIPFATSTADLMANGTLVLVSFLIFRLLLPII
jgi:mgtE-like transporter